MSVTINHALLPVHFSRNAVEVQFSTPDKYTTSGQKGRSLLLFSTFPTSGGETLEVEFTKDGETYTQTFTFAASPDADLYEIEEYSGSGLVAWLGMVIAGLQGDFNLADNYNIGLHADDPIYGISFRALFEDDADISFTATGFNIVVSHPFPAALAVAQANYRLSAWLFLGANNSSEVNFTRSPEIELDADENSAVQLNLKNYLDTMLYDYEAVPTSSTPVECTSVNRPAYLLFGQKWGDPVERKKNFKSPIFRVIKGGLTDRDFAEEKADLPGWLHGRFLTNRYERTAAPKQSDYLYWVCNEKLTNVKVLCEVVFPVGPAITAPEATLAGSEIGRTYKFKVVPKDYYFLFANDFEVVQFNVWLAKSDDTPITEKVSYKIENHYLDQVFEYENSQGVIESWKFRGERSIGHEITKALYRTELPFDAAVEDNQEQSYNERDKMTMTVSTGPLSKSESRAFPDFLRSRYIWLVDGATKVRVRIPEGKHLAESWNLSGNHTRGGEFTVELGESRNVSSELI
jgi:hypothetical protein